MAIPQGIVTFNGVQGFLQASFTFTHGVRPNVCQIQIPPTPTLREGGTLSLLYGGTRIDFPDCKIDFIDFVTDGDGLERWTLNILDRRWKWQIGGQVSGYYNVRKGKSIVEETIRKPRELAKLCLEAMGERGYDLSRMPNDTFPEIDWDYKLPAEALAELADKLKCRVVLRLNNTVAIIPAGEGRQLEKADALQYAVAMNPPERPDELIFVGDRTLWEDDIELEPVARDFTGEYLPLQQVGHRPQGPAVNGNFWWRYDPGFANIVEDEFLRELSKQDVYRAYRIRVPFDVPNHADVTEIWQVLPLLRDRLATVTQEGVEQPKPPLIWGLFASGYSGMQDNAPAGSLKDPQSEDGTAPQYLTYERGWRLDVETGIVFFDEPVFKFFERPSGRKVDGITITDRVYMPAELWLRTTFGVRDPQTRQWHHEEVRRKSNARKFGTKPQYIRQRDIGLTYLVGKAKRVTDNRDQFEEQANHYLDEWERQYDANDPQGATYPGFRRIDLDGAIWQVTWSVSEAGATTHVSANREEPHLGLTYAETRLYQQLQERIINQPPTARLFEGLLDRRPV